MKTTTRWLQRVLMLLVVAGIAGSAYGQRTVTLRLNTATLPDTLKTDSVIRVMGAVDEGSGLTAPYTLPDGNIISWDFTGTNQSTITATNVGGDYWEASFQVPNEATTTFKFFSHQAEDHPALNGWEADPNPTIPPGTEDTTLVLHFFESQDLYRGVTQDRGPYDWRPYEDKEDSVAVWFRVAMMGPEADRREFDPASDVVVGVRGAPEPGSALDWGASVPLQQESTEPPHTGYRMYSGVIYFPESSASQTQEYKFVYGDDGWEEGNLSGNRTFTIPEQDTTLHWVFFGNTPPVDEPAQTVESLVLFTVDLSPFEEIGLFDRARGDTLWVYGSYNGWQDCPTISPDLCLMMDVPGEPQFELAAPLELIPGTTITYKYFLDFNDEAFRAVYGTDPPSGWEEGHESGTDRRFVFEEKELHDLGFEFFNDITSANVIPEGTSIDVHFSVDMTPALALAEPFNPAEHQVYLQLADPIWGFTQGFPEQDDGGWPRTHSFLTDEDGDNIYTGTLTVTGPTYSAITYRYAYGTPDTTPVVHIEEAGSGQGSLSGRSRTHFIVANNDGSWPAEWDLPAHVFQPTGPVPYETNPAFSTGVEQLPGEQPTKIALGANYPNPFNPTTSFEYSLTGTEHVKVRVFDAMGRQVATLVDGVQTASTYRVTFDGSHLASGVYLYQLETPTQVMSRKMVLIK